MFTVYHLYTITAVDRQTTWLLMRAQTVAAPVTMAPSDAEAVVMTTLGATPHGDSR